jgi:hypothetical protein
VRFDARGEIGGVGTALECMRHDASCDCLENRPVPR